MTEITRFRSNNCGFVKRDGIILRCHQFIAQNVIEPISVADESSLDCDTELD